MNPQVENSATSLRNQSQHSQQFLHHHFLHRLTISFRIVSDGSMHSPSYLGLQMHLARYEPRRAQCKVLNYLLPTRPTVPQVFQLS